MKIKELLVQQKVYHGTSLDAWNKIKESGKLSPQINPTSFFRGNASTIPGVTSKHVYLTPDESLAEYYAEEQANHIKSKPVIIAVDRSVLKLAKCYPDDDYIAAYLEDNPGVKFYDLSNKWRKSFKFTDEFGYRGDIPVSACSVIAI